MSNDLANKERVSLPRMLFLPTVLASFVMNKNCTPWEIYEEINCLLLEGVISDYDDLELIRSGVWQLDKRPVQQSAAQH
jgi:hypothetical protein